MAPVFCVVDDKHIPLYRILWVSDLPHFCGNDDCACEGRYEIRLKMDESVWANREEKAETLPALEEWAGVSCVADDKHVPLYRILWVSDVPHSCDNADCAGEGRYEIRLEMNEWVWASRADKDQALAALEAWGGMFCAIDGKHIPLHRILWVSDLPHFCGDDDCECEGRYEIRLEMDESVWSNREERDQVLAALEAWADDPESDDPESDDPWA